MAIARHWRAQDAVSHGRAARRDRGRARLRLGGLEIEGIPRHFAEMAARGVPGDALGVPVLDEPGERVSFQADPRAAQRVCLGSFQQCLTLATAFRRVK